MFTQTYIHMHTSTYAALSYSHSHAHTNKYKKQFPGPRGLNSTVVSQEAGMPSCLAFL